MNDVHGLLWVVEVYRLNSAISRSAARDAVLSFANVLLSFAAADN
jgi:hypothetical protein